MITVKLFYPPLRSSWIMATNSLTILVDPALVIETSGIVYSVVVGISWVVYPHFEWLVFLFPNVLTFLMIIISLNIAFGDPVLGWVVAFLRSHIDDRRVYYDITDVYYLNFLIGIVFNKITLLSIL